MPVLFWKKFKKLEITLNGKVIKKFEFEKLTELQSELHIENEKLIVEIKGK